MPAKGDDSFLLYACNHHWIDKPIDVCGDIYRPAIGFGNRICLPISKNRLIAQLEHEVKSALSPPLSWVLASGVVRNAL